ncbi:adenylosuccinate lyase [Hydrogenivirga sp. 128-5-R1-1]|uniref:adenylosuccinate lyase n=1 Tax=Hydrogenivirga sp. 128-5-R1-1 TaxID=392423 RepID=UPI00015F36A9|nr:adenylosuccinate lyase [Hydrogenivirga sp. 128-5-R1-1]EDP76357.1 adenylosuccinate lyase [Hydrogenivirga sp. 128-5-R1-1]
MIERYTRREIGEVWSEKNKFQKWLDVEIAVCRAWAELGRIPRDALRRIEENTRIDDETLEKIREYDRVYKHDVLAFVSAVSEQVGEDGRFIHLGLTSSDVIDTALALLMREALEILIGDVDLVLEELKKLAHEHKDTLMIGRTHGVHAEPTTFGIKLAVWYNEMRRNRERLVQAKERVSYGKISGAVGTYSNVPPEVERIALEELGLRIEPASTQVVHRDRHAEFMAAMAITASSLDKFATEIRHLQRTEVLEVQEPFTKGQRGSSAMPHKKNPIHSERICGLARVIRSNLIPALENIVLWHERDISHSSVERVILPDSSIALDYILHLFHEILRGLVVNKERMLKNMELSKGLYFSSKVLVALTEKGMTRDRAYDLVQRCAMESWNSDKSFKEVLLEDPEVTKLLSRKELESIFDPWEFLKHRDYVFAKVFG